MNQVMIAMGSQYGAVCLEHAERWLDGMSASSIHPHRKMSRGSTDNALSHHISDESQISPSLAVWELIEFLCPMMKLSRVSR